MDRAQRGAAQTNGGGNVGEAALHEHDVRGVYGDVGTGADGDADVGPCEGGRVVYAVADHCDFTLLLEVAYNAFLPVGKNARDHLVNACLSTYGFGGTLVVAGEHDHMDAHVLHLAHGGCAVLLDDVGHGDYADELIVLRKEQRGLAVLGERFGVLSDGSGYLAHGAYELVIAACELAAVERGGEAVARQGRELAYFGGADVGFLGLLQYRAGKRMLALLFKRVSHRDKLVLAYALGGQYIGHLGFAGGYRAGLVEGDDIHLARFLKRDGGFEQYALLGALAVADHYGDGRRKTKRAGAAYDKHRNAACKGEPYVASDDEPYRCGYHRNADDHGNEHARNLIGDLRDGRLRGGGVADHLDDLGKRRILAHTGGLAFDEAGLVDRRGGDHVADGLVNRYAFAGEGGFIDSAVTFGNDAVNRYVFAGAHNEEVALADLIDGNLRLLSVAYDDGCFGGKLHKALERVRGFAL